MDILDLVMRFNPRPFLRNPIYTIDLDLKKITTVALKTLITGTHFHYKNDAFAFGFTLGILTRFITKQEFRFNEINRSIDQYPFKFLQTALIGHLILFPASLELGAIASGFYTGIGISKLSQ
jgi:hypothetical protein